MKTLRSISWENMIPEARKKLVRRFWIATWVLLLLGWLHPGYFSLVVFLSLGQALIFFQLFNRQLRPFPVQVRVTYFFWVAIGTFVPGCRFLMLITTVGLAGNLFFRYCPLARMLYLAPWNRNEPLTLDYVRRVFLSPPAKGAFIPGS